MDNSLIPIKEAAGILGVTMTTLRRWDKAGDLKSVRVGRGHRYYNREDIDAFFKNVSTIAWQWTIDEATHDLDQNYYCPDSAVFQTRLETLRRELMKIPNITSIHSLIVAASGEIGNNSFDHNLGNWPDVRGIFFGFDMRRKQIVLADRGIGILASLRRVRPTLSTHEEALKVAFTERVTGRAPESRGNGLKLVRKIVCENPVTLEFRTGNARLLLRQGDIAVVPTSNDHRFSMFHGCFAILTF